MVSDAMSELEASLAERQEAVQLQQQRRQELEAEAESLVYTPEERALATETATFVAATTALGNRLLKQTHDIERGIEERKRGRPKSIGSSALKRVTRIFERISNRPIRASDRKKKYPSAGYELL